MNRRLLNPRSLKRRIEEKLARALMRLPRSVIERLAGRPMVRDGLSLDPQLQLVLIQHAKAGRKNTHELTVAEARAELEINTAVFAPPAMPLARIEDMRLPGPGGEIPVRVYRPYRAPANSSALIFFHGGGFVLGSLDSHDAPCRALAARTACVVIAVDYRLAPEHPFPAAADDAVAAFRYVAIHAARFGVDAKRLAVGGDSAGGNLAAVVAQQTRSDEIRPCFQLLIYPGVDMTQSFPSIETMSRGFLLERETIDWFMAHYLPAGADRRDPRASPLFATSFAGLPPAFILTAGFDPLRDEGQAYARRLAEAHVPVQHRCYESLIHGFFNIAGSIHAARAPLSDSVAALQRAFAGH